MVCVCVCGADAASKRFLEAMYQCIYHHKGVEMPVEWKDIFLGLSQVMGGSKADVVNFMFDLVSRHLRGRLHLASITSFAGSTIWMAAEMSPKTK